MPTKYSFYSRGYTQFSRGKTEDVKRLIYVVLFLRFTLPVLRSFYRLYQRILLTLRIITKRNEKTLSISER